MEYHVLGYLLSYSLYLVLNSTLPDCKVNNAQLSSPCCQVSIPKLPTPHHQCNIVKLPSPNSLCELPEWASQCPTKKMILGCQMHKLLFWPAEASAQKFRLPLNLFFTGCLGALCPPPPFLFFLSLLSLLFLWTSWLFEAWEEPSQNSIYPINFWTY
jgi:hypothetical protein